MKLALEMAKDLPPSSGTTTWGTLPPVAATTAAPLAAPSLPLGISSATDAPVLQHAATLLAGQAARPRGSSTPSQAALAGRPRALAKVREIARGLSTAPGAPSLSLGQMRDGVLPVLAWANHGEINIALDPDLRKAFRALARASFQRAHPRPGRDVMAETDWAEAGLGFATIAGVVIAEDPLLKPTVLSLAWRASDPAVKLAMSQASGMAMEGRFEINFRAAVDAAMAFAPRSAPRTPIRLGP